MKRLLLLMLVALTAVSTVPSRTAWAAHLLIPMDLEQTDHLKAYGVAFWTVQQGVPVEWLLNFRGGAFLTEDIDAVAHQARLRNVAFKRIDDAEAARIYAQIDGGNMDRVKLETAPRIAVYTPPNKQPWDDAVTLALSYAEIPYDTLWDREVLGGELSNYDWLHLHHEDFTGQYGKFYRSHGAQLWYRTQQAQYESLAAEMGFASVPSMKGSVSQAIRAYVEAGGFLFAMCSATDTFDISLAAWGIDIVDSAYDGDPPDPSAAQKLDYGATIAFENFQIVVDPMEYEHADIDILPDELGSSRGPDSDAFSLFEFSAKYDPVPAMLTQNHVPMIPGFMGQTTAFRRSRIKRPITVLGDMPGTDFVKYIHGSLGKGTFTFYAGHDPEDYQHFVGDPSTQLALHRNSPGYRLILNNVLFPAARKKKRKT